MTSRAKRFEEIQGNISEQKAGLEELRDELQNWLDNMPENLQNGQKAEEIQTAIDELENIISSIEEIEMTEIVFPGMY